MLFDRHASVFRPQKHGHALVALGGGDVDAIEPGVNDCGLDRVEPLATIVTAHGRGLGTQAQRVSRRVVQVVQVDGMHIAADARFGANAIAGVHIEVDAVGQARISASQTASLRAF